MISSHGYEDYEDEMENEEQYEAYAMRRSPQQNAGLHMTQQMTTKVAPSYDGRTTTTTTERIETAQGSNAGLWPNAGKEIPRFGSYAYQTERDDL